MFLHYIHYIRNCGCWNKLLIIIFLNLSSDTVYRDRRYLLLRQFRNRGGNSQDEWPGNCCSFFSFIKVAFKAFLSVAKIREFAIFIEFTTYYATALSVAIQSFSGNADVHRVLFAARCKTCLERIVFLEVKLLSEIV